MIRTAKEILRTEMSKYPNEATKGYKYLEDWIINAMEEYAEQFKPNFPTDEEIRKRSQRFDNIAYQVGFVDAADYIISKLSI